MLKPIAAVVLAAALCGATLVSPDAAQAREAVVAAAAPVATAHAQMAAPKAKRARKAAPPARQVAAVAPGPRCFLFWCDSRARPFFLVLGVAY